MLNALVSRDVDKYLDTEVEVSISKALEKPSITTLINQYDVSRTEIATHVDWIIEMLTQTLNVKASLTEFQKKDLVYFLMDQYKHETLDDFILCFKMGKSGQLGPIYGRIDREVIGKWMTQYLEMKSMEREAAVSSGRKLAPKELTAEELADWYRNGTENQKALAELNKKFDDRKKAFSNWQSGNDHDYNEFKRERAAKVDHPERKNLGESNTGGETPTLPVPESGGKKGSKSMGGKGQKHSK